MATFLAGKPSLMKSTERTAIGPSTPHAEPFGISPVHHAERLSIHHSRLVDQGSIGLARKPAGASEKLSGADWSMLSPRTEDGRHVA